MKIVNTLFNVVFPTHPNIRKKVFNLEDTLKDFFVTPFNLIQIPEDAPFDIPRIVASSKNGHTQMTISLNNLQIQTNFDENYSSNWEQCCEYINKRVNSLFPFMEEHILMEGFLYSGFSATLIFEDIKNPSEHIFEHFFKFKTENKLSDIGCKLTFLIEDTFYVNISLNNFKLMNSGTNKINFDKEVLGVVVDVNDRYKYNKSPDYRSDKTTSLKIIEIVSNIIKNKIEATVRNGEIIL